MAEIGNITIQVNLDAERAKKQSRDLDKSVRNARKTAEKAQKSTKGGGSSTLSNIFASALTAIPFAAISPV